MFTYPWVIHVLVGFILSYAVISIFEWWIHRFHMHRRGWLNRFEATLFHNHILHHASYPSALGRVVGDHTDDFSCLSGIGIRADILSALNVSIPVFLILLPFVPIEAIILLVMSVAHPLIWTAFHLEIHKPTSRWFSNTVWYRACLYNHNRHHCDPSTHYCVIFLGADYLFRTISPKKKVT
jgi:hypothetical protein